MRTCRSTSTRFARRASAVCSSSDQRQACTGSHQKMRPTKRPSRREPAPVASGSPAARGSKQRHPAGWRDLALAGQHLHEPLPQVLAPERSRATSAGSCRRLCRRPRHPLSPTSAGKAHEVLKDVMTRIGLTVNETKTKLREATDRALRLPRLHLRSLLGPADGKALSRCGTFAQEPATAESEGARPHGAQQCAAVAGGSRSAQHDVERMAGVLRLWHAEPGLQRRQLVCRQSRPSLPQASPQGPFARITQVPPPSASSTTGRSAQARPGQRGDTLHAFA